LQNSFILQKRPFEAVLIHSPQPTHMGRLPRVNRGSLAATPNNFKIIGFKGQSSFAIASRIKRF